jgi:hypothetical protein
MPGSAVAEALRTGSSQSAPHVVRLRALIEQADPADSPGVVWLLAQALAEQALEAPDSHPALVDWAAEGLAVVEDALDPTKVGGAESDASPAAARRFVKAVLEWRSAVGNGDRVRCDAACRNLDELLADGPPPQVADLAAAATRRLRNSGSGPCGDVGKAQEAGYGGSAGGASAPAPWVFDGLVTPGEAFDLNQLRTAFDEARARAETVPESDPRRARLLAVGSLGPAIQSVALGRWSEREERLLSDLRAAIEASPDMTGPTSVEQMGLAMLQTARCMAGFAGHVELTAVELATTCEDLRAAADAAIAAEARPGSPPEEDNAAQFVPILASFAGTAQMMLAGRLASNAATWERVEQALAAGERLLARAPRRWAERVKLVGPMLRMVRFGSDADPEDLDALERMRAVHPDFFDGAGGGFLKVVWLANRAAQSGDRRDIDAAIDAVNGYLVDLATGHPQGPEALGLLAHLLVRRAALSATPADVPMALNAGLRACRQALDVRGDASGPTVQTTTPLMQALCVAVTMDLRAGPFEESYAVLADLLQWLDRQDAEGIVTDPDVRLSATIGAGAAGLLRWRSSGDPEVLARAHTTLDDAERLLLPATPTLEWLRPAFQLLTVHMSGAGLWHDGDAAKSAARLLDRIEEIVGRDPSLATLLHGAMMPGALTGLGLQDSAGGLRDSLRMLRGILEVLQTTGVRGASGPSSPSASTSPSGFVGSSGFPNVFGSADRTFGAAGFPRSTSGPPDLATAAFLLQQARPGAVPNLEEMMRQASRQAGLDPDQARQMISVLKKRPELRQQLGAMMGSQAGLVDQLIEFIDGGSSSSSSPSVGQGLVIPGTAEVVPPAGLSDGELLRKASAALADAEALHPSGLDVLSVTPGDLRALATSTNALTAALEAGVPDALLGGRIRRALGLCQARSAWWTEPFDPKALRSALTDLNGALAADRDELPSLERVRLLDIRARCQRRLTGSEAASIFGSGAVASVRAALRELARCVIALDSLSERVSVAAMASPIVRRAAAWAIEDGDLDEVVAVVENGRTLSLAAVMLSRQMTELAGSRDGSARTTAVDDARPTSVSQSLLADVSSSMDGQALLLAPTTDELGTALLTTGVDAIVYLVPPVHQSDLSEVDRNSPSGSPSGYALVLRGGFSGVIQVPLPADSDRQHVILDAYQAAHRRVLKAQVTGIDLGLALRGWQDALDDLGRWAYSAVVGPLLKEIGTWELRRPAHLALLPVAEWAAVPFAAAWRPDLTMPAGKRFAVHDLVLTHAASGRAFLRAASAEPIPIADEVLLVVDPDPEPERPGGLAYARVLGRAVRHGVFPNAAALDRASRAATIDRVLAALPSATTRGSSLLHVSTHARNQPDVAILLADGWLPLARILDNAYGMGPGRPGGVVIVDACVTDVIGIDPDAASNDSALLDESLTLATGLLAAGAKHVIGTRWPVADGCAAVLAFHLHRHLADGFPPAQALRAAQLDLLDGSGSPAVGGGALSRVPAEDLASASAWAAYTHQGV